MVTIRHEFSEAATGYRYPVVAHEFMGQTLEEARAYFRAHLKYDRMLREVSGLHAGDGTKEGLWNRIRYRSVVRIIQR